MGEAAGGEEGETLRHRRERRQDALGVGAGEGRDAPALEVLHHQEGGAVDRQAEVADDRQAGVLEAGEPGGEGREALALGDRVGAEGEELDHDGAAAQRVRRPQDAPGAGRPQDLLQAVALGDLAQQAHADLWPPGAPAVFRADVVETLGLGSQYSGKAMARRRQAGSARPPPVVSRRPRKRAATVVCDMVRSRFRRSGGRCARRFAPIRRSRREPPEANTVGPTVRP